MANTNQFCESFECRKQISNLSLVVRRIGMVNNFADGFEKEMVSKHNFFLRESLVESLSDLQ